MGLRDTNYYVQNNKQEHRETELLFCNNFEWSIIYKNTESLCCTPEESII